MNESRAIYEGAHGKVVVRIDPKVLIGISVEMDEFPVWERNLLLMPGLEQTEKQFWKILRAAIHFADHGKDQ